jgi:PAB1-binding protein PBP1
LAEERGQFVDDSGVNEEDKYVAIALLNGPDIVG